MKRSRKRSLGITVLMVMLLVGSAACGGNGSDTGSTKKASANDEILRVGTRAAPSSMDPLRSSSASEAPLLYALYDTLIGVDQAALTPLPGLAESWDQSDPKTLVLKLQSGVTFHDGTPFNAEAVKFNLERAKAEGSNIATDVANVVSIDVVSDLEVKLRLSKPDTSIVLTLADKAGMMVSPTAARTAGDKFAQNPVGAGPFKFDSYRTGEMVKVRRYDGYWKAGQPYIGGIDFNVITENSTAVNAVRSGQQDLILTVPFQDIKALQAVPDLNVTVTPSLTTNVLYINTAFKPFDDVRVREALNLAVDRKALVDTTLFGFGEELWTPFPSAYWAQAGDLVPTYKHDPKRARALLAEAGHSEGITFELSVFSYPIDVRRSEVLKSQLAEAGFDVKLVVNEVGQGIQRFLVDKKYPVGLAGGLVRPDPTLAVKTMFDVKSHYNPGKVAVPGLDEALEAANGTADEKERAKHLRDAQAQIAKFSPFVPLVSPKAVAVARKRVQDYVPSLQDKPNLNTIRLSSK